MYELAQLSNYGKAIVEFLTTSLHYSEKEAVNIVTGYYSVVERIGLFDNPKDWALKIDEAMRSNITPDMWLSVL